MTLAETPVLAVRGLTVAFDTPQGTQRAVEDVSFTVRAGETLALVGESGSGKSVVSLSILRLLGPTGRILAGEARFRERSGAVTDLATAPAGALRRIRGAGVGMVFQEPMTALNPALTIGAQVAEAMRGGRRAGADLRARACAMLAKVGVAAPEQRLAHYPHQLSGGLRQRVMIAMAAAAEPSLLIADEPTTALDVTTQAQVLATLRALQSDTGMGLVFITHDLALASLIADRILVMYAGRIVEAGVAAEVVATPRHPYTRALLDCLPARHPPRAEGAPWRPLRTIEGAAPHRREALAGCAFAARCPEVAAACGESPTPLRALGPEGRFSRCLRAEVL
jgi:oligopeptide/dipeptide ABC transporter ATP-binding protein